MKNIIVTVRSIKDIKYKEDYYSISHDWIKLIKKLKINPFLVTSDSIINSKFIKNNKIKGLILTNGEDVKLKYIKNKKVGNKRDLFEANLINIFLKNKLPILGICRGHQLINNYFKGKLSRKKNHAGTNHTIEIKNSHISKFLKVNSMNVNSYHNYVVEKKNSAISLIPWAMSDNTIEGYYFNKLKILTIMWHPERKHRSQYKSIKLIKKHFNL